MAFRRRGWFFVWAAIGVASVMTLVWWLARRQVNPVAVIRVVDGAGEPIAGAVIQPEGLRTKPGPYVSGWYGWMRGGQSVSASPVMTDLKGEARLPYPKYVFEKIEAGTLCLAVNHPDYVPQRPECVVNELPTAGTPLREWADFVMNRFRNRAFLTEAAPVVLRKGGILEITVRPDALAARDAPLFGQISGNTAYDSNAWIRPEVGHLVMRRLADGTQSMRVAQFDAKGTAWFSAVERVVGKAGARSAVTVDLVRGATLRGTLDATVRRPVRDGKVIAHVWPVGLAPSENPPQWHAWAAVDEEGGFEIRSLPAGLLEVVGMCRGYISTNGPGRGGLRYPQKHALGTNDLSIAVGMEPTADLQVEVRDDQGQPLPGAQVMAAPNVQYGGWAATIVGSDLYDMGNHLRGILEPPSLGRLKGDYWVATDAAGVAVLRNLPIETDDFSVEHPLYALPAIERNTGQKSRAALIKLQAGQTNYASVTLERRGRAPIAHR